MPIKGTAKEGNSCIREILEDLGGL